VGAGVLIVGGGMIGGSIACELARHGLRVQIFDRQQPGLEASWAAAGMLAPTESHETRPLVPLAQASFDLYPAFVAAVEEASGLKAGFVASAGLHVFFGDRAEAERDEVLSLNRSVGVSVEAVDVAEARRLEPGLNPAARAALVFPNEGRVDNRALTDAVLAAASKLGVGIHRGKPVEAIEIENGRCVGVRAAEETFAGDWVVMAAGCFSAQVPGAERYAPTRPVRGQMVALRYAEPVRVAQVIRSERGYVVPREDGRLVAGSTLEDAGFEKRVTPEGLSQILRAAAELVPALSSAAVVETWSGLRPGTPDHLPILGPTDLPGLLMATGHYRNGILLAPFTARLIREWIVQGEVSVEAGAFSPLRFERQSFQATR
jgi:glycine oxidase